jgi:hypothetical protein
MWDRLQFRVAVKHSDVAVGPPAMYSSKQHESHIQGARETEVSVVFFSCKVNTRVYTYFRDGAWPTTPPAVTETIK